MNRFRKTLTDFLQGNFKQEETNKILFAGLASNISTNTLLATLYATNPDFIENDIVETIANYGLFSFTNYSFFTLYYTGLNIDKLKEFKKFSIHKSAVFGVNYIVNYSAPIYLFSKPLLDISTNLPEWQTSLLSGILTLPFPFAIAYSWDNKNYVLNKISSSKNAISKYISDNFPTFFDYFKHAYYEINFTKDDILNFSFEQLYQAFPFPKQNSYPHTIETNRLSRLNQII